MAPKESTAETAALDDDAPLEDGAEAGIDEFDPENASAAADEFAAYAEAGKTEDVDKVRELIAEDTKVRLGFVSADLATAANNKKVAAGHEYVYAKFEVNAPEKFADGSRNFGIYLRLSAKANDPQRPQNTGWNVSRRILVRLFAAVYQCKVTDARAAQFDQPALTEAANCTGSASERRMTFFNALTQTIRDELVGKEFDTDIGVDAARTYKGRTYREAQNTGRPYYPERERSKPKSAKKQA